jgi:cytosine/adenosine deaminase-related metal-dependent hydrolase
VGSGEDRRLVHGVDVVLQDGRVAHVGASAPRPPGARVVDASEWLVLPGLVNAHHHLSQQLTRGRAPGGGVIEWLAALYPAWSRVTADIALHGARVGLAELVLTGVTPVADLTYFYPRGHSDIFDAQMQAAAEIGCRMLAVRGGLRDIGDAVRRLIGDEVSRTLESGDTLTSEIERVADVYHDPSPSAMRKVTVGLHEPLWTEPALMTDLAALAKDLGLRLHTHLHPRPSDLAAVGGGGVVNALEETGWWGDHLWIAHGTALGGAEIPAMVRDGVALATCPSSNARLGSPIAPAWRLHREGGVVAVGVDGAASNDCGDFVGECRLAWQVQRIRTCDEPATVQPLTPEVVLQWATTGGARALGWPGLGELTTGGLADVACFDLSTLEYAGIADPLSALLLCGTSHRASLVVVAGDVVVENGTLARMDEQLLARAGQAAAHRLCDGGQY